MQLRIVPECFQVIGLDVGSTHVHAQSMNLHGEVLNEDRVLLDCINQPNQTLEQLIRMGRSVLRNGMPILGIGLSVPCPVNNQNINTNILPKWRDIDFSSRLSEAFMAPVFIENDANAGALSELWWGEGRDLDSLLFIKLGTGVGAGIINNRRLIRGIEGFAGEIGHIYLRDDILCRCGRRGCLEAYVGMPAIRHRAKELGDDATFSSGFINDVLLEEITADLSSAIVSLLNVINPQGIVIWGDLLHHEPRFIDKLRLQISISKKWANINATLIRASSIKGAIALGACTLVLEQALLNPALFLRNIDKETF